MPAPLSRQAARAALQRARARQPTEPAMMHAGQTYPESDLRRLQASGNLQDLGPLAALAADFLRRVDSARAAPDQPPRLITVGGDDSPPVTYALPAGWMHTHIVVTYEDEAPDYEDAD